MGGMTAPRRGGCEATAMNTTQTDDRRAALRDAYARDRGVRSPS
jgi:hypothetical protein